jgi:hypothetical protein
MVATKKSSASLQKALKKEGGASRECVFKGFYIYRDQYVRMLELTAQNKINGVEPSSQSEILRTALDEYLDK